MPELQLPFPLKDLPLKPELTGRIKVDDVIIQTLSAIMGYDGEARRLLTCALGGVLQTTSPPVYSVVNKVTTGAGENITFGDTPTTEIIIYANPNNTGDVWCNLSAAAAADTGWLLQAGDSLQISLNNLKDLRLHVVTSGDKVIILRTV